MKNRGGAGVHHQPSLCDASWERQEKIGEGR